MNLYKRTDGVIKPSDSCFIGFYSSSSVQFSPKASQPVKMVIVFHSNKTHISQFLPESSKKEEVFECNWVEYLMWRNRFHCLKRKSLSLFTLIVFFFFLFFFSWNKNSLDISVFYACMLLVALLARIVFTSLKLKAPAALTTSLYFCTLLWTKILHTSHGIIITIYPSMHAHYTTFYVQSTDGQTKLLFFLCKLTCTHTSPSRLEQLHTYSLSKPSSLPLFRKITIGTNKWKGSLWFYIYTFIFMST